jgi:hypothetical protein
MSDLYDRLEEIQGMTRVLAGDVASLGANLGSRSIQDAPSDEEYGARRAYVRAIFALVEATVEQHKRLLLDLSARRTVMLDSSSHTALSEQTYFVSDNGNISVREQYLQLRRKIFLVYRVAGEVLVQTLDVRFDDQGWQHFGTAIEIRDRITHPKSFADCHIEGDDVDTVDAGHDWFRQLSNEFVRVAREHRAQHPW